MSYINDELNEEKVHKSRIYFFKQFVASIQIDKTSLFLHGDDSRKDSLSRGKKK